MKTITLLSLLVLGALMTACGAGASPEATIRSYILAIRAGDAPAARAEWLNKELLNQSFTCASPKTKLARSVDGADFVVPTLIRARESMRPEVANVSDPIVTTIVAGSDVQGCSARHDIRIAEAQLSLRMNKDDKTVESTQPIKFLEVEGRWYLVAL